MSDPYIPPQQPGSPPPQPPPTPNPPPYGAPPQPPYGTPPPAPQPPYPTQPQQPQYAPPPQPPQYGAPQPYGGGPVGPPPAPKGNKGCLIAVVVVLALLVVGSIAGIAGLAWLGNKAEDAIVGEGTGDQCPFVSNAEATEALGTPATATYFGGIFTMMNVTDSRVLPDKASCYLVQDDGSGSSQGVPGIGRALKYTGSDAEKLYQQELTKAKGVTEDRGNGQSVSTDSYFNKDVPDLGDEAFCIKSGGIMAGVLAHRGDTLVYVAVSQASETTPGIDVSDPDNPKLGTDDANCDASVTLARKILG